VVLLLWRHRALLESYTSVAAADVACVKSLRRKTNVWGFSRVVRCLAPMVGASELAFRLTVRSLGSVDVTWTPMIDAKGFAASETYRREFPFSSSSENAGDVPCVAQVAGRDAGAVAEAAQLLVELKATAVELNVGCPQRCARTGKYGAYLLDEPDLLVDVVRRSGSLLRAVKLRVYDDHRRTVALAKRLVDDGGVRILTVHGRTRLQRERHRADWEPIRLVKQALQDRHDVLVIANGDVRCLRDLRLCAAYTNCDGVMAGRALLFDPACLAFQVQGPSPTAPLHAARTYLRHVADVGAPWQAIRRHLAEILHRVLRRAPHLRRPLMALRGDPTPTALDQLHRLLDDLERIVVVRKKRI